MNKNYIAFIIIVTGFIVTSCNNETTEQSVTTIEKEEPVFNDREYLQKGADITQTTFKALSSRLQQAIADGGVANALQFCSVNAQPLTDSLSNYYDVSIKRTSHKIRNPLNAPNPEEEEMINSYLVGNTNPIVQQNKDGSVSYYAPIKTKGLCLVCHGEVGKTIASNDYKIITSIYPDDKAINFKADELRGIWSLTFKAKENVEIQ